MERPLTPKERREAARKFGAGTFHQLLLQQLKKEIGSTPSPSASSNDSLSINIPREWFKTASYLDHVLSGSLNHLSGPSEAITNARTGFNEAARSYEGGIRKKQLQSEAQLEKQYLDYLTALREKRGSLQTPCIDSFCEGVATMLECNEKNQKDWNEYDISDGQLKDTIKKVLGTAFGKPSSQIQSRLLATGIGTQGQAGLQSYAIRDEISNPNQFDKDDVKTPKRLVQKFID